MKIRAYLEGDEQAIMALDERELPSRWNKRTVENWYWKFTDRNPAGHASIWVAEDKNEIIAHFAAVPYRLKVFDQEIIGSHSIGSLVDKRYQNRGLIKFVGEKMFEELKEKKVLVTWGFPNQRAHEVQKVFLGYEDLIHFDTWKLEREDILSQQVAGFAKLDKFDAEIDDLWNRCKSDYEISVIRDQKYLNWRYLQRPDQKYYPFTLSDQGKIKGYIVLKLYEEGTVLRGHIVDIFAAKNDKIGFSKMLDGALSFFKEKSVDEVTSWIWGSKLVEKLFTRVGFQRIKTEKPLIFRVNLDFKFREQVKDNSFWYFTMADSTEIF